MFSGYPEHLRRFEDTLYGRSTSLDSINDKKKVDQIDEKIEFDPLPLNQRTYDLARAYLYGNLKLDSKIGNC